MAAIAPKVRAVLDELKRELEALYGDRLVKVVLFGSHARGDADPDSDIDVLVVLRGPVDQRAERERMGEIVWRVSYEHDTVVFCLGIAEEEFGTRGSPLLINVRREGVPV